jgi:hypothetical protein
MARSFPEKQVDSYDDGLGVDHSCYASSPHLYAQAVKGGTINPVDEPVAFATSGVRDIYELILINLDPTSDTP